MELKYKEFSQRSIGTKIAEIEDFFEHIDPEEQDEKEMRVFFRNILENETDNYLRKISLETLCALSCSNKVRLSALMDIMLDIDNNDDPFLLIITLRYLSLLYETDESILHKIESNKYNPHEEVCSEAYYRHGMIQFYQIKDSSEFEFLNDLYICRNLFLASVSIENRADAEFYISVIEFIEKVLSQDIDGINTYFDQVTYKLWSYSSGYMNESKEIFEHQIYKTLYALKNISLSVNRSEVWSDFYMEFVKLSEFNYEFHGQEVYNNKFYRKYLDSLQNKVNHHILRPSYYSSLKHHKLRIQNIIRENVIDTNLVQFLQELNNIIDYMDINKKKDSIDLVKYMNMMKGFIPEAELGGLLSELQHSGNTLSLEVILNLITSYRKGTLNSDYKFIAGFPQGQEIFFRVIKELNEAVPDYPYEKLRVFKLILEEVIRYLLLTMRGNRDNYRFLYNEKNSGLGHKAVEQNIQDSLFDHLMMTNIAYLVTEESKNFSDGGRVDLVLKAGAFVFPIELKRTANPISYERVREKYLEQVATYIYSYDQLGIFVLLDLNEKTAPVNDVRELIYLDHMKPLYELDNHYPDYIVVCIVPGNKPLPNQKSAYN